MEYCLPKSKQDYWRTTMFGGWGTSPVKLCLFQNPEGEDLEGPKVFLSTPMRRLLSRKCQDPYGCAGQKNRRQWSCGDMCWV